MTPPAPAAPSANTQAPPTGHLLILGLGYTARAYLPRARAAFAQITGTARTAERAARADLGVEGLAFDGSQAPSEALLAAVNTATHVLVSVQPDEAGEPVLRQLSGFLRAAPDLVWVGYLSTVGVYGDHAGAWVEETTPCQPKLLRSRLRLAAETAWGGFAHRAGKPVAILRLAGIYGPGRNAFVQLERGEARRIIKPGQVFNRIHVDDIAATIAAAAARRAGGVFNVADDEPAPPQDVVYHAAEMMGVPPPRAVSFVKAEMTAMARSFYSDLKRVRNAKLKSDLGVTLTYPNYRAGLAGLWAGDWRGAAG